MIPQHPGSVLSLQFSIESGATAEITIPLTKLIRYGLPLCTTLWLGLPLEGGSGMKYDISEALARGNNPDIPKVVVTIFRPSRNQDFHGLAVDPQPDVHGALTEDIDTCTGPVKKGPTAIAQIKGLIRALRVLSFTTHSLQEKLFTADRSNTALTQQLQDTMRALTPTIRDRMPNDNGAAEAQVQQMQEMLNEARHENTRLQVEKAELQERSKLQEGHWRQQLESAGLELHALRSSDQLRSHEMDRLGQELGSFQALRAAQEESHHQIQQAHTQLEELEALKGQVQTQRGQQQYLQRELTLATEELQSLKVLDRQRKSLSQDHAQIQDELVRTGVTLEGAQKELSQARQELKNLPGLEKQVQYLDAELKSSREKVENISAEQRAVAEELVRAKATSETLNIEKNATTRMLEDQLARVTGELEAFRTRDLDKPAQLEEKARERVELESLRNEKQQWREDLESECHRWNSELESLRLANERQVALQDELAQKSVELEVLRLDKKQQQSIQNEIVQKTTEIEVQNKVEGVVLQETLDKLRAQAPQRLKDLREECTALRAKDKERVTLKEEVGTLRMDSMRQAEQIRDLQEAEKKAVARLEETKEELDRKKSELLNMRAEREVLRTGEVLRQELVDENLSMREELDKLKKKDANARKDLQDQLARACEELNVLRGEHQVRSDEVQRARGDLEAWTKQKSEGSGVVTV